MRNHNHPRSPRSTAGIRSCTFGTPIFSVFALAIGLSVCWLCQSRVLAQQSGNPYGFGPPPNFSNNTGYPQNGFGASQPDARIAAVPSTSVPSIPPSMAVDSMGNPVGEPVVAPETAWQLPSFVRKIADGGWLMLPLGLCSLVVLGLSLERMIALRRSRVIPKPFVLRFTESVEDGQLSYEEATAICDEFDCPVAEVFQAAVRRWGRPMLEIEQAVIDAGDRVSDSLRRFLRVFHAISNVAPLIGLLGTVLGMIDAFEMISNPDGTVQSDMLAGGISVALMTTAGGLTVAIPAYLAYMYFSAKSEGYLSEIDKLCQRVIDCISAEGLENNGANKTVRKRKAA